MSVPHAETQAAAFVARTQHNGEGVRVAILDTGVDPGHPLLQRTPSGAPKVVALIDATGSGDVHMRARARSLDGGRTLRGASGRVLTLNPGWPPAAGGDADGAPPAAIASLIVSQRVMTSAAIASQSALRRAKASYAIPSRIALSPSRYFSFASRSCCRKRGGSAVSADAASSSSFASAMKRLPGS